MRDSLETWFASLTAEQVRRIEQVQVPFSRQRRNAKSFDEITVLTIREHTRTVRHFDVRIPDIVKDSSK